jgi:hypothetical protein
VSGAAHIRVHVEGIGLWAPRLPGWEVARPVLAGEADAPDVAAPRPSPALLPPNERRRAPDTVAISLEVGSQACAMAGRDPATLPCVFASTHGDLAVTDYMCETLATTPALISPTKFHNSVHNAAAGYWTIATGCMAPYTAISAYRYTFAQGLLEAMTQACSDGVSVLYVAYDIAARGPLANVAPSEGLLAVALVLTPTASARTLATLDWRIRETESPTDAAPTSGCASLVSGNAMAACLPLFEALAGAGRRLSYALGPRLALDVAVAAAAQGAGRVHANAG